MAALGITLFSAALLCVIAIVGHLDERDFEQPIILPPAPEPYQPRHSTEGLTTRLNPPPMRPEN